MQGPAETLVVPPGDPVLAMVAAELGEEGHRLAGSLRHQFSEHPAQCQGECRPLLPQIGGEQVTHRIVDGEPGVVEPPDQCVRAGLVLERRRQYGQRFAVVEAHGRRL